MCCAVSHWRVACAKSLASRIMRMPTPARTLPRTPTAPAPPHPHPRTPTACAGPLHTHATRMQPHRGSRSAVIALSLLGRLSGRLVVWPPWLRDQQRARSRDHPASRQAETLRREGGRSGASELQATGEEACVKIRKTSKLGDGVHSRTVAMPTGPVMQMPVPKCSLAIQPAAMASPLTASPFGWPFGPLSRHGQALARHGQHGHPVQTFRSARLTVPHQSTRDAKPVCRAFGV